MVRVGDMLLNKGVFQGEQVLPAGWVEQMITPSKANPNYGMQIWLGNEHKEFRPYDARWESFANIHREPYKTDDVFFMDGIGKQRIYIVPSKSLVIVRTGYNSREWDDSMLPNLIIEALN